MDRSNHYEAAFEGYLQEHRLCYVAVNETRRTLLGELPLKSLDFIVHSEGGARLLVDVKGRRFPAGTPERPRRVWECWSTREDIDSLERWAGLFGPGYQGLLVFLYHLQPAVVLPEDIVDLWCWHGRRYLVRAVAAGDYRQRMRVRSQRWETVYLPGGAYRELVAPFQAFTRPAPAVAEECPF
jgi:hypothetical protein